ASHGKRWGRVGRSGRRSGRKDVRQSGLADRLVSAEPGVVRVLLPLPQRGGGEQLLQRRQVAAEHVQHPEQFLQPAGRVADQVLEGEGVVGVAAPEQVGQLPNVVEQLVRVVGGGRLQK